MKCDICGGQGAQPRTVMKAIDSERTMSIHWTVCMKDSCLSEVRA